MFPPLYCSPQQLISTVELFSSTISNTAIQSTVYIFLPLQYSVVLLLLSAKVILSRVDSNFGRSLATLITIRFVAVVSLHFARYARYLIHTYICTVFVQPILTSMLSQFLSHFFPQCSAYGYCSFFHSYKLVRLSSLLPVQYCNYILTYSRLLYNTAHLPILHLSSQDL